MKETKMTDTLALIPLITKAISDDLSLSARIHSVTNRIDSVRYVFKRGRKLVTVNIVFHSDRISIRYDHPEMKSTIVGVVRVVSSVLDAVGVSYGKEFVEPDKNGISRIRFIFK